MIVQSRKNPRVMALRQLMTEPRARKEQGLFVCEGLRLCLEAADAGLIITETWMTLRFMETHPEGAELLRGASTEVVFITESIAEKMAGTVSPQGVFCVCKALDNISLKDTIKKDGLVVALERIQDPGNLGTALRCAFALGFSAAVLIGESTDPFSPKVLRASMGASFRLPICRIAESEALFDHCRSHGVSTFAAVVEGGAPVTGITAQSGVLLIGNEANGLMPGTVEMADASLTIPMPGGAESLNASAAATILMWEMAKHRMSHKPSGQGDRI